MNKSQCQTCKAPVDALNRFPGGLCLGCYAKVFDTLTEAEKKPDFLKAINLTPLTAALKKLKRQTKGRK
jgi:hypothetical protein